MSRKQPPHGTGDEDIARSMEAEADWWNENTPQPDWEELGTIEEEAKALRAAGKLNAEAKAALMARAADAIPADYLERQARLAEVGREIDGLEEE